MTSVAPVAVVGAGPGIGAHTARRFAAAGHQPAGAWDTEIVVD